MPYRVWVTLAGDMTCPICRSLNGRLEGDGWSTSGQPPENGWLQVGGLYGPPPLHDHCRCRIVEYPDFPVLVPPPPSTLIG